MTARRESLPWTGEVAFAFACVAELTSHGGTPPTSVNLLVALLRERLLSRKLLTSLGANIDELRESALREPLQSEFEPAGLILDLAEMAQTEAQLLADAAVASEHLLLALLRLPNATGANLLQAAGITFDVAREAVTRLAEDEPGNLRRLVVSQEEIEQIVSSAMYPRDNGGNLIRVVGIGQTVSSEGILLELIALEVRELFAVLHWRAAGVAHSRESLLATQISVRDDLDATYGIETMSVQVGSAGTSGVWHVIPPPQSEATAMTVEVSQFTEMGAGLSAEAGSGLGTVLGRWRLDFSLR